MFKKAIAVAGIVVVILTGCDPATGGKRAKSASFAGDGITQVGNHCADYKKCSYANKGASGKIKWNTTYNAHKVNPTDVQNCEWSVFSVNSEGVTKFLKKGHYGNAKIRFEEASTVKVYLKSIECGIWEP